MADEVDIAGIKRANPDISELADLMAAAPDDLWNVGGAEISIWPAISLGVRGNTATGASALPEVFGALWDAGLRGNSRLGLEIYRQMQSLRNAYAFAGGQAPVIKEILDFRGLAGGAVRPPLRPLGDSLKTSVRAAAAELLDARDA